jgi:hypothetical protein
MRPSDAPPVPKGKVRQLYPPPPPPDESAPSREDSSARGRVVFDEAGDEENGSVFVSDAEELEERRRRARERADARRHPETPDGAPQAFPEEQAAKPFDAATPESDEWPVF